MMNKLIPEHTWQRVALMVLLLFYLITRLIALSELPIFIEEASYLRWINAVQTLAFGRFLAVMMGLFTLGGVIALGNMLYSWKTGLLAGLLYIILPYAVFYDRLAMVDGFLRALGVWLLIGSILLAWAETQSQRLFITLMLVSLSTALALTKLSGMLYFSFPVLAVIVLLPRAEWRKFLPYLMGYGVLMAAVCAWRSVTSDGADTYSLSDYASSGLIQQQLSRVVAWYWILLTLPMFILMVMATVYLLLVSRQRVDLLVVLSFFAVIIPNAVVADAWLPRDALWGVVPIALIVAQTVYDVEDRFPQVLLITRLGVPVIIIAPLLASFILITQPENAFVPEEIRTQFVEGWAAGYGYDELAAVMQLEYDRLEGNVTFVRFDRPFTLGLEFYLSEDIDIQLVNPVDDSPDVVRAFALEHPTYLIFNLPIERHEEFLALGERVWEYRRERSQLMLIRASPQ